MNSFRLAVAAMFLALFSAVVVTTRAHAAFFGTGNVVSDMAMSIGAQRGLVSTTTRKLAYGLGAKAAGGSVLGRILKRTPVGKVIIFTTVLDATTNIIELVKDVIPDGDNPGGENPDQPDQADAQGCATYYTNVGVTDFTDFSDYNIKRANQAPGTFRHYRGQGFLISVLVKNVTYAQAKNPISVANIYINDVLITENGRFGGAEFYEQSTTNRFSSPFDGYRTGSLTLSMSDNGNFVKYLVCAFDPPASANPNQYHDVDSVPAEANLAPKHFAEDLNELLYELKRDNPTDEVIQSYDDFTEDEVQKAIDEDDTRGKAGRLRQNDPEPDIPDLPDVPDDGGNPPDNSTDNPDFPDVDYPVGDVYKPWRDWMEGPFKKYLKPSINPIPAGKCPSQVIDMGGMFSGIAGTVSNPVTHSEFCDYVQDKRPLVLPVIYFMAGFASFFIAMGSKRR